MNSPHENAALVSALDAVVRALNGGPRSHLAEPAEPPPIAPAEEERPRDLVWSLEAILKAQARHPFAHAPEGVLRPEGRR